MNYDKETVIILRHIIETAEKAYQKGINLSTDFLNLNEQSAFFASLKELPDIEYSLSGGTDDAERRMIMFHGSGNNVKREIPAVHTEFPISCLKAAPLNPKFSEKLTHRDFLGVLMGLGIERSIIGDIFLVENTAYIFVKEKFSDMISRELYQVRHTDIYCEPADVSSISLSVHTREINGTIASNRADAICALGFNISRNHITEYFSSGKVYVNGRQTESLSAEIKTNDIVSIRGLGRFRFMGENYTTKKGKLSVSLKLYV